MYTIYLYWYRFRLTRLLTDRWSKIFHAQFQWLIEFMIATLSDSNSILNYYHWKSIELHWLCPRMFFVFWLFARNSHQITFNFIFFQWNTHKHIYTTITCPRPRKKRMYMYLILNRILLLKCLFFHTIFTHGTVVLLSKEWKVLH